MEEKKLKCTLISPMFSYGAYQKKYPEIRASEIKGMMRYVYRIICPTNFKTLAKDEAILFGGAVGSGEADSGHASPVRILIYDNNIQRKSGPLLLHKTKNNPPMYYLQNGDFEVIIRLNPYIMPAIQKHFNLVDLNWYTDFLELAFMLCGLGKRSRKGRGSVAVNNRVFTTKEEALKWIFCTLNNLTTISSSSEPLKKIYMYKDNEILSTINKIKRPVIQKLRIGMKLTSNQVKDYLYAIDKTCHDVKSDYDKKDDQKNATGSAGRHRFASPLLISLIKTREGLYPIYVFVKAIYKEKEIDPKCINRDAFIYDVERIMEG